MGALQMSTTERESFLAGHHGGVLAVERADGPPLVTPVWYRYEPGGSPDARNYRVDFSKIARELPEFQPVWTVRAGIEELYAAFRRHGLSADEFLGGRYLRIRHVARLRERNLIDASLRWRASAPAMAPAADRSDCRPPGALC